MVRAFRIVMIASFLLMVIVMSGCTGTPQNVVTPTATPAATQIATEAATPAPAPSLTPSISASPVQTAVNQTVENQYQYTENLQTGIDQYNLGVGLMTDAQNQANNKSDWTNASTLMLRAKDRMDSAKVEFQNMTNYSNSADETTLSQKWAEAADYASTSLQ
ncbi:MAG TPA: hypothetical protein VK436_16870, partial [Methanocella sp.]|nr:hypothetical protein [Methanocella sp.]